MARPPVHYATTADDLEIAYQVLGAGPFDVVIVSGFMSNLDHNADSPFYSGYIRRIPRFARTIVLNKRGSGVSDRDLGSGSAEDRMSDIRAVMDAVGSARGALLGQVDGGAISILFAATHPERVSALVLVDSAGMGAAGLLDSAATERFASFDQSVLSHWGTGRVMLPFTFDVTDEEAALDALALLERSVGTPRSIMRQMALNRMLDVRPALSLITVPTLVLHRAGHPLFPEAQARAIADGIPGARYVEVPSLGSWDEQKQDTACDVIEEFLTGQAPASSDADRILATVLFTDIVDSTRHATTLGDRRWRALLDAHDHRAAAEVARFRGRVVKHTGDGVLAVFDGPARAVRCAHAIVGAARALGVEVRAGLHTGEVEERGQDVSGLAVHIGARIAAVATAGEVLVSSTVRDLVVGSGLSFDDRGPCELRGVEGTWRLLAARPSS